MGSALLRFFRALSDRSRLRLLALLSDGPRTVNRLATALRISQPKASRHLAYLRQAGLVHARREGRQVYYRICAPRGAVEEAALQALKRHLPTLPFARSDRRRLKQEL